MASLNERKEDAEKLKKTEIKLVQARSALFDATQELYTTFGYYEELGAFNASATPSYF